MEPETQLSPAQQAAADIDMEALLQEWRMARTNRENFTNDFVDLDNIVDGVPVTKGEGTPFVGDTTLAGLVRSIPRGSIQQLPVFAARVNGSKVSIDAVIASWILRRSVFNEDTFGKGILSTLQVGGEQALTHGYAPFMCATGSMYDEFGTTMRLLHYADVDPETGIQDASESGFFYVAANLTKTRVQKIRDSAMNNPNTSWLVAALDELLEMQPATTDYAQYLPASRNKQNGANQASTYQFITRYEVGKKGRFVTFCPQLADKPLRVMGNKSKFGFPRVQFLVIDPAPLTPFGVSRVRLASPNQNLMNAYYQNIIRMLLLNSDPPILQRGRFSTPVQLKQRAKWIAIDQNATADLKQLDNGALAQFVPMAQQVAAQIQNIMGSPTGTVNGNSNAFGFSKTAPGVKMQQSYMDLSTQQVTNIMENLLRQYALTALDTHIAEQTLDKNVDEAGNKIPNEDTLILDDEAADAINRIAPGTVGEDNRYTIDWNDYYDRIDDLGVEIELSLTKNDLEEKQRSDLQDTLTTLLQNRESLTPNMAARAEQLLEMLTDEAVPASSKWSTDSQGVPGMGGAGGATQAPFAPQAAAMPTPTPQGQ